MLLNHTVKRNIARLRPLQVFVIIHYILKLVLSILCIGMMYSNSFVQ